MYKRIIILLAISFKLSSQIDTIKTYYEDGAVKSKEYHKKNKIYGILYYEDGTVRSNLIFTKDSMPLSIISYDRTGNVILKRDTKKSTVFGPEKGAIYYYKIKNGKYNGKATTYVDGILIYEMNYINGLAEGIAIGYDEVTKDTVAIERYTNGKLNGIGWYYNRGNVLSRKLYYKDGCPYKAQTFNKNGELVYETEDKEEINTRFRSTEYCN